MLKWINIRAWEINKLKLVEKLILGILKINSENLLRSNTKIKSIYNNNNVYFKSLSYTNVLFKLEMKAQTK
jgi:hypothetical protein